jgi:hypothetical protein
MSSPSLPDLVRAFNALPRPRRAPSGLVPNHWHISIRQVPLQPPGHLVFLVQPDSHYVDTQGPIERAMGQALGDAIDLESEATALVITRLILQGFVNREPETGRPWSWSTNDAALAGRVIGIMRRLGVEEALLDMPVAGDEENASCDEDWEGFLGTLGAIAS